jgi:hypothetical protein
MPAQRALVHHRLTVGWNLNSKLSLFLHSRCRI